MVGKTKSLGTGFKTCQFSGLVGISLGNSTFYAAFAKRLCYKSLNRPSCQTRVAGSIDRGFMRAVLQRVTSARVRIDQQVVGEIDRGVLVLLGVARSDTKDDARWLADKIVGLRIFNDADGKMNLDLAAVGGAALVVSQFTLYGDCRKGRRPSFVEAAAPEVAIPLYEGFINDLRAQGIRTSSGHFGAMMEVELVNDGPVTLILDSK